MRWLGRGARERGQTLTEFALVAPIFAITLLGLFDFGRVVYTANAISNDAREGARVGAVSALEITGSSAWQARYAAIRSAARNMQPGVTLADAEIKGCATTDAVCMQGQSCPAPLDTTTGTCFYTCPAGLAAKGCIVHVEITTTVPLITPLVSQVMGGSFTLHAASEALVQS